MIDLNIQIKLILFSFIFGMLFKVFEIKLDKYLHKQKQIFNIMNSFTLILFFSLLYFYNIELIVDGILHPYSIILVILGYYLYKPIATFLKK